MGSRDDSEDGSGPNESRDEDERVSRRGVRATALTSSRWSIGAVVGRQMPQLIAALFMARILGPETYGVISAATVYTTLTTLLLDQGLAVALVQRPALPKGLPGAIATVNLLSGAVLAGATVAASGAVADFFGAPTLRPLLVVLGVGLLLKSAAITPRAMLQRGLDFRSIGYADIVGGVSGAAVAILAVSSGASTWSMAWQVLSTDLIVAIILLLRAPAIPPNLRLHEVREVLPFSLRVFGSSALAYLSRNLDNILVGKYLGVGALSLYSMSYRVLVVPVQMIGQTVNRVIFPLFSRMANQPTQLARGLLGTTEMLAFAAIPLMLGASAAAPQLVLLVLGPEWLAAAPVLTLLCIAGARETVFYITQPLMRAKGAGKLIFRYEWLAALVQLSGIVIGLQFGVVGVAAGVLASGFVLTPVLLTIQRMLTGVRIREQLGRITPPLHASLWGGAAYLLAARQFASPGWALAVGGLSYLSIVLAVLWLAHRAALVRALTTTRDLLRPGAR